MTRAMIGIDVCVQVGILFAYLASFVHLYGVMLGRSRLTIQKVDRSNDQLQMER